jgi:Reverse transcriptase (RNA-dependent DNA polymerase)
VSVGDISCPVESAVEPIVVEPIESSMKLVVPVQLVVPIVESVPVVELAVVQTQDDESETRAQGELRVYTRRKEPVELLVSCPLSLLALTPKIPSSPTTDSDYPGDMISLSTPPTPLSIRQTTHSNARVQPDRYGFYPDHDITHYVSYSHISPNHGAFITSLDIISLPKCWQDVKKYPKWKTAMLEELGVLAKNKTWQLVLLPPDKKIVGYKWIFTVKHNSEGRVERYKARLVAKRYSQTYDFDYDETFAPVTKMSTVRTLVSLAANKG